MVEEIDEGLTQLVNRTIVLQEPQRLVFPPPWIGHIPFAFWIVEALRPCCLVELGTHSGNSYCAFLQAVRELGLPTACHAVDTWKGDLHAGFYDEEVYKEFVTYHDPRYGDFSRLVRMTFDDALPHFADRSIDLLHIDGLHSYEAVAHNLRSWLPKMSSSGVVLMHDINVREQDFGVWRLWEEVSARYPSFSFQHSNGLGVAWVGNGRMPDRIARIFGLSANNDATGVAFVRRWFATLGSGLVNRFWADWRARELAVQYDRLVALNGALEGREREMATLQRTLRSRADAISVLEEALADRTRKIATLEEALASRSEEVARLDQSLADMHASTSWRVTAAPRWVTIKAASTVKRCQFAAAILPDAAGMLRRNPRILHRAVSHVRRHGLRSTWRQVIAITSLAASSPNTNPETPADPRYAAWLDCNRFSEAEAATLQAAIAACEEHLPLISIIMPVYETPVALLDRAIESVMVQVYQNWELCIADDASSATDTRDALRRWSTRDGRIRVVRCEKRGNISRATNEAARLASGEFLAFLDHDDELSPDALAEVAIAISSEPEADYLYSDDDKIDINGRRFAPQFKPDWAPTLLLSYMYLGHVKVVRRSLFERLGGFRLGFEGAQDYDFALRMSESARKVVHIPKVLYHWRVVPGSTAAGGDAKPASFEAGRRAVAEALERRGVGAVVSHPEWAAASKIGVFALRFPDIGPHVAILIPARNRVDLLRACLKSLESTTYSNYEIVVIDNESDDPEMIDFLESVPHRVLRIGNPPSGGFNFSYLNNEAVRQVDAEYVLLLNNDTAVRSPNWLSDMVGCAGLERVGAVGARLLFANGNVQHAGIVHGYYNGMAGPAFRNTPDWNPGYLAYAKVVREYSAVTAACLLTPRALYLELGGLDEEDFAVAYSDVDYCYRLSDAGWRCVYCPSAELFHYEGESRGFADDPSEVVNFRRRYGARHDPFYNPNLSLEDELFRVRPYHTPTRSTRPVRIVMVSHNLNREGAPQSQLEMTVGLKRSGVIDPVVITPLEGPLRMDYEQAGIEVHVVPSPLANVHTASVLDARLDDLGRRFTDLGADLVYANTLLTFWAIAAGERVGLPTLWNVRESEPWQTYFDYLSPELRRVAYSCFSYPYRVIFVAHATRAAWASLESRFNFAVIHNGLDCDRLEEQIGGIDRDVARRDLGIEPNAIAVALVGTVCERKGQVDLVHALRELPASVAERLRVFIVGDRAGPYSDVMHRDIATLPPSLRNRIVVVPETADVARYYRVADIAVCTSRIESYPRVVLEAMACGLAIVTTPVFGIREQVRDGINGLFYEPGDVTALASTLKDLVNSPTFRDRLAGSSRLVLQALTSYPDMLKQYGAVIREAAFSRGRAYASDVRNLGV